MTSCPLGGPNMQRKVFISINVDLKINNYTERIKGEPWKLCLAVKVHFFNFK